MLRECTTFLKENEKVWKREGEETSKMVKNTRLRPAQEQKHSTLTRTTQKKITKTWKKIPEHERRHLLAEKEKRRRLELREIKLNIWKKWRKEEDKNKLREKESRYQNRQEALIEKLEETLEKGR